MEDFQLCLGIGRGSLRANRVPQKMLKTKRYNINSLSENFDMSRPAVSKHISILHTAGFITIEDVGREQFCKLNKKGFCRAANMD